MSTRYFNTEELKEIAATIVHYIVKNDFNIDLPKDYSFLYKDKTDQEKQIIYINNVFNRIHYINSLAYSVNYKHSLDLDYNILYVDDLGHNHFTMKELYKQLELIIYNCDYFVTIEIKEFIESILKHISDKIIYY